jgi:hypothetical protein
MKKLLAISAFAALAMASCKKKETTISELRQYSKPTIVLSEGRYYSIPVGGILPTIKATAYDSFYHEDATVLLDQSKLDNTVPGIYTVIVTAKNTLGMAATDTLWVAVTNIPSTIDLSGKYLRVETDDTMMVTRLANGFYHTSDAAGNGPADTTFVIPAVFVQTSNTGLVMPVQNSKFGTFYGTNGFINMGASDTTFEYTLRNNAFAPVQRVFHRL